VEKKRLGNTDFLITPIGLGAWAMGGGGWVYGWGPQDDKASIAAIHRAVDLGINWIDTAAVYGLGHSEGVVAKAVSEIPRSNRPLVFTKCSLIWDDKRNVSHSLAPASLQRELENSLRRLNVDAVDLYQIHWPGFPPGDAKASDAGIEDAWHTLSRFQRDGKVRHLGASNFNVSQLERIGEIAPVGALQPPYSMLKRGIEAEVLPYCAKHNIGIIHYSPMQSGLLSGTMTRERIASFPQDDWRRMSQEFREPRLTKNLRLVELLRAIGKGHGRSPGEVAIAWTLRSPSVTGAIVGARSPAQVDGFIGAAEFRLSKKELEDIEGFLGQLP
jgi:aryl-alcohol dehydrogenase-like predicted oxidoreductase